MQGLYEQLHDFAIPQAYIRAVIQDVYSNAAKAAYSFINISAIKTIAKNCYLSDTIHETIILN